MGIQLDFSLILAIYVVLLLFGMGYNALVSWAEKHHYLEGYTAFAVVLGVGVTIGMTAVISLAFALVTAGAFVASGLPMIVGSIWRHVRAREMEQADVRQAKIVA